MTNPNHNITAVYPGFVCWICSITLYQHLEECKLILCCWEGTRFSGMIDEIAETQVENNHAYQSVLKELSHPSPKIEHTLEYILITYWRWFFTTMSGRQCRKSWQLFLILESPRILYVFLIGCLITVFHFSGVTFLASDI